MLGKITDFAGYFYCLLHPTEAQIELANLFHKRLTRTYPLYDAFSFRTNLLQTGYGGCEQRRSSGILSNRT